MKRKDRLPEFHFQQEKSLSDRGFPFIFATCGQRFSARLPRPAKEEEKTCAATCSVEERFQLDELRRAGGQAGDERKLLIIDVFRVITTVRS
jgi:hypothetical protein